MMIGATKAAIDLIKRAFPEGCEDLEIGRVLLFRLGRELGEPHDSLGLEAIEPEYVRDTPSMKIDGMKIYFCVPDDYPALLRPSILHFNSLTREFEALEVVLADK